MYTKVVSITKQGQISIPAIFRKYLNLQKEGKALLFVENKKLIIEPYSDLMELDGALRKYSKKEADIQKVISAEENTFPMYYAKSTRKPKY